MKRFLLIVGMMLFFIFALLMTKFKLSDFYNISSVSTKTIDLGFVKEVYFGTNYKQYKSEDKVVGESVQIKGNNLKLNKLCDELGVVVLKKYFVNDKLIIEGVSSMFKYRNENSQANIQICLENDIITVGLPIIYGSY